ncbi:MAG: isoprenylcysteine carboxylmethyltransferase family protein [Sphingobium sp.]|nr:isoprenylcysteine carboxylmethyltransferase family protein [Sphingobium sp.]MCP5397968.1 isoprenylcysteine carboxylmethyltransferase family protein [Sphingomonas sp.]
MQVDEDSAKVTFPPPFVYLGFLLIGMVIDRLMGGALPFSLLTRSVIATPLIALGIFLLMAAGGHFRRAGTEVKPWKTVSALVDDGVYSMTRNPMYLGMALLYTGLAIAFRSIGALLLLPAVILIIQTQVIAREERYMEEKFGDPYRAYKGRVRRWL